MDNVYGDIHAKDVLKQFIEDVFSLRREEKWVGIESMMGLLPEIEKFPVKGIGLQKLKDFLLHEVLPLCRNFRSPFFMAFPDSGNADVALLGSIFSDFAQQNLINSKICSPIATYMEAAVIKWFRALVGYDVNEKFEIDNIGGIVTYGGTVSNTVAMLLARNKKHPDAYTNGIGGTKSYVIVPHGIAHYSIKSALQWIGCGSNIIEVKTKNFRYDLKDLEEKLLIFRNKIMALVVYAGDSRTMTIDDISGVCNLVKSIDPNIWIHVDACNGFCLYFHEKLKSALNGAELCDSITMDPHKMMMMPYTASLLLVKNPLSFSTVKSETDLITKEKMSFGQITPFIGSKAWLSLKIWCVMKGYGQQGLREIIDKRQKLSQYLRTVVNDHKNLILLNDAQYFSVVFMFVPDGYETMEVKDINVINKKIHEALFKEGKIFLHQFGLKDNKCVLSNNEILYPLRFFSGNPLLTKNVIDQMINEVLKLGQKFS